MLLTPNLGKPVVLVLCLTAACGPVEVVPAGAQLRENSRTDRYGDPLPTGALLRLGTSRFRHDGAIYSFAYSPDGRLLVTGNSGYRALHLDASVVVWDARTGKHLRTWHGHAHVVRTVAVSHDNKHLAVTNGYGQLRVCDLATGKEPRKYDVDSPGQALFTPQGQLLVADRSRVRRWDMATGKELPPLYAHYALPIGLTVAANGKTSATYARDGSVSLWDSAGNKQRRLTVPTRSGVVAALSPDGKWLAAGTFDEELSLWDTATGHRRWLVKSSSWRLSNQAFSPDGKVLATGGDKLRLWDAASGKLLHQIDGPYGTLTEAVFAPDGKRIATAGNEAAPRFWDPATGKETLRYEGHQHAVRSGLFTADGKSFLTVSDEPFVHQSDLATGQSRPLAASNEAVVSIALARNGDALATCGEHTAPVLWNLHTGKPLRQFTDKDRDLPGHTVRLSADGKTLAATTGSGAIRFWETATARQLPAAYLGQIQPTGGSLWHYVRFVLAPDGKSVATTRSQYAASGAILWDIATKAQRVALAEHGEPVAFSPDGRLVAIVDEKEVRLVNTANGAVTRRLPSDAIRAVCAAFSPDGRTVATAGHGGTVSLWETATGRSRGHKVGHDAAVNFVTFAPDGRRLASGGDDHTVLIWDLTAGVAPGPLTAQEADALWTTLAGDDATKAYTAIRRLSGDPERAVPLLKARLRPVAAVDPKRLAALVAALDSENFDERQQATHELEQLGELAEAALRRASHGKGTLEQRRRVELLLHAVQTRPPAPAQLRDLRALEVLEHAGTDGARRVLEMLATGVREAVVTREAQAALRRLAR